MGVGSQIPEHLLGTAEGPLEVGDPVGLGGAGQQQIERGPVLSDVRRDGKRPVVIRRGDGVLHDGAKAARENPLGEEEGAYR